MVVLAAGCENRGMDSRRVICSWPNRIGTTVFMAAVAAAGVLVVINFNGIIPRVIAAIIALAATLGAVRSVRLGVTCTADGFVVREVGTTLRVPYKDVDEIKAGMAARSPGVSVSSSRSGSVGGASDVRNYNYKVTHGRGSPVVVFLLRRPHRTRFGPPRARVVAYSLGAYSILPGGVYRRAAALEEIRQKSERDAVAGPTEGEIMGR